MKYGSKHIFNVLFVLTGLVAIWVGALFANKLIMYAKFSNYTQGKAPHWGIISLDENRHRVCVDYMFKVESKSYTAQHMYMKPTYNNQAAARYAKEAMESDSISVWYLTRGHGKDPLSIVDRQFPINELLRFSVVVCILGYFYFLKRYLYFFSTGAEERESPAPKRARTLRKGKQTS